MTQIQSLAWELLYVTGVALKIKTIKKFKKKKDAVWSFLESFGGLRPLAVPKVLGAQKQICVSALGLSLFVAFPTPFLLLQAHPLFAVFLSSPPSVWLSCLPWGWSRVAGAPDQEVSL